MGSKNCPAGRVRLMEHRELGTLFSHLWGGGQDQEGGLPPGRVSRSNIYFQHDCWQQWSSSSKIFVIPKSRCPDFERPAEEGSCNSEPCPRLLLLLLVMRSLLVGLFLLLIMFLLVVFVVDNIPADSCNFEPCIFCGDDCWWCRCWSCRCCCW